MSIASNRDFNFLGVRSLQHKPRAQSYIEFSPSRPDVQIAHAIEEVEEPAMKRLAKTSTPFVLAWDVVGSSVFPLLVEAACGGDIGLDVFGVFSQHPMEFSERHLSVWCGSFD